MTNRNYAAPCGLYCGECEHLGENCKGGCGVVQGKPFWTALMKVEICPLYDCAVNKHKLEHCGKCAQLPCGLFREFHDPALSPDEAEKAMLDRCEGLKNRAAVGTEAWLKKKRGR